MSVRKYKGAKRAPARLSCMFQSPEKPKRKVTVVRHFISGKVVIDIRKEYRSRLRRRKLFTRYSLTPEAAEALLVGLQRTNEERMKFDGMVPDPTWTGEELTPPLFRNFIRKNGEQRREAESCKNDFNRVTKQAVELMKMNKGRNTYMQQLGVALRELTARLVKVNPEFQYSVDRAKALRSELRNGYSNGVKRSGFERFRK